MSSSSASTMTRMSALFGSTPAGRSTTVAPDGLLRSSATSAGIQVLAPYSGSSYSRKMRPRFAWLRTAGLVSKLTGTLVSFGFSAWSNFSRTSVGGAPKMFSGTFCRSEVLEIVSPSVVVRRGPPAFGLR